MVMAVSGVAPGLQGLEKRGAAAPVAGEGAGGSGSGLTAVSVSRPGAESQGRF